MQKAAEKAKKIYQRLKEMEDAARDCNNPRAAEITKMKKERGALRIDAEMHNIMNDAEEAHQELEKSRNF